MLKKILFSVILLCAFTRAYPQSGASLGMQGMTAISRGVDAVYWNPANLARQEAGDKKFQLVLYSLNLGLGNNSFSYSAIEDYIGDGESIYLTESDKDDILGLIDDDGLIFDFTANASVFSWAYKNFGFAIETRSFGEMSIPKDIYKNILVEFGNNKYDYSIKGNGFIVGKYKISYGQTLITDILVEPFLLGDIILDEINFGASLSYLQGYGYAGIKDGTATLDISQNGILPIVDVSARTANKGRGLGLDMGLGFKTRDDYYFGAVVENLFARIKWYDKTEMSSASVDFGSQPLFIAGDGQLADIDIDSVSTDTTVSIGDFSTSLPINFRFALAKDINKFTFNLEMGRENSYYGTTLGCKYDLGALNLFASISKRYESIIWSGAMAINFSNLLYIDFGVSSRSGMSLASTRGLFYGTSMKIMF